MSRRRDLRSAPLLGCLFAASLSLTTAAPAASETAAPPSDRRLSESTTLQFTFSQIRQTDISVALGRLILYDVGGAELAPTSCASVQTISSAACENLFDGSTSTQWRDDSFASPASTVGSSTLRVTVPGVPAQYEFFTYSKKDERDPVAWTVGVENTCGGFTQVGAESVVDSLANTRSASYGSFAVDVGAAPVLPESACLESDEYRFTFTGGAPRPAARPPARAPLAAKMKRGGDGEEAEEADGSVRPWGGGGGRRRGVRVR